MPPTIASPLRMLLLSTPGTSHPPFIKDVSHHEIRTAYYTASIPIWRDDLPTTTSEIEKWKEEWLGAEAGEVVQAVGAWVVCFRKPTHEADLKTIRMLLSTIHEVVDHHTETSYVTNEPLLLAVGNRQTASPGLDVAHEEWEDLCRECGGWEWIDGELDGIAGGQGKNKEKRNEFGEKVGIERLKEALEANEWDGVELDALSDDLGLDDGFGAEAAQVEREMMGLKMAVQGDESDEGGDESVDELETMMLKMQAIKDMGADMPDAERRKFAAKAVAGVTKNL